MAVGVVVVNVVVVVLPVFRAGVVWWVYVYEVNFVLVVWQQFLESGIVVGGDEDVIAGG